MNRKLGSLLASLVILSACGQTASTYTPNGSSPSAARATAGKATSGPTFVIAVVLPDGKHPAAAPGATVNSLKWSVYVKQKRYVGVADSFPCQMGETKGVVGGCAVAPAEGTASYDIRKSAFTLYSQAKGKGCVLATGSFKGTTEPPSALGMTLKAENIKTCWKG